MKLKEAMFDYIKLQRTQIKNNENINDEFYQSIQQDLKSIIEYIPKQYNRIIDIGCGIGGIDLALFNNCKNTELFLLDYNKKDDNIYYGYNKKTSAYNSLELAKEFLMLNGVPKTKIGFIDAAKELKVKKADIIISLISCGFHYPVSTYLEYIKKCMKKNTVVILDIRKETDQFETLHKNFTQVKYIKDYQKYIRVLCKN